MYRECAPKAKGQRTKKQFSHRPAPVCLRSVKHAAPRSAGVWDSLGQPRPITRPAQSPHVWDHCMTSASLKGFNLERVEKYLQTTYICQSRWNKQCTYGLKQVKTWMVFIVLADSRYTPAALLNFRLFPLRWFTGFHPYIFISPSCIKGGEEPLSAVISGGR